MAPPTAASQSAPGSSPSRPLVLFEVKRHVATITFNRPERYNAWTLEMIAAMQESLKQCAADDNIQAAIITGSGLYYCSGVDFSSSMKPMWPSTLLAFARDRNKALFDSFLDFPKPLFAAVNGPAIGASVTSAALCDAVLASSSATFHTPFRALGVVPEGCSSVNFPKLMGETHAKVMLEEGRKLSAAEACDFGLISQVVEPAESLLDCTQAFAEAWIRDGRGRTLAQDPGWLETLRRANAEESEALARSFLQAPFLNAQYEFAASRGKTVPKMIFWTAKTVFPLISRL